MSEEDATDGEATREYVTDRDPTEEFAIDGIAIEPATPDDRLDVLRVLDAAMLETDAETVAERIDAGDVLVARFRRTDAVVGALAAVRHGSEQEGSTSNESEDEGSIDLHVEAVAVRRARRGRGIGSALVARAVERAGNDPGIDRVTATFGDSLAGFYVDLGFETRPDPDSGRLRGIHPLADPF